MEEDNPRLENLSYVCYPYKWERLAIRQPQYNFTGKQYPLLASFKSDRRYESWKQIYSIPDDSPAKNTSILCFSGAENFGERGVEWIESFTHVGELQLHFRALNGSNGLVRDNVAHSLSRPGGIFAHFLHLPSATVKYLTLVSTDMLPSKQVFDFICSFPHLVYLRVGNWRGDPNRCYVTNPPPNSGQAVDRNLCIRRRSRFHTKPHKRADRFCLSGNCAEAGPKGPQQRGEEFGGDVL